MSQSQVIFPRQIAFAVRDYDLAATLASGQAFRWNVEVQAPGRSVATGIIGNRWVRLHADEFSISAETAAPLSDWKWLVNYLQLELDLNAVMATFPDDEPMRAAVNSCRGLRLLRQEPWECLASFILSSTKQIVQIRQIVAQLCECYGEPILVGRELAAAPTPSPRPSGGCEMKIKRLLTPALSSFKGGEGEKYSDTRVLSFPTAEKIAGLAERDLRNCKMGFRAPYLLETAQWVAEGKINLEALRQMPVEAAREELMKLPGVGRKIADCVLLFAYGFQSAFPVDVWVMKALQQLYFSKRRASIKRLRYFAETHFGPNAGYAQQYLFHYMRMKSNLTRRTK